MKIYLSLLVLLTVGCSTVTPIVLDTQYEEVRPEGKRFTPQKLNIMVQSVTDNRKDKESLGRLGVRVSSTDVLEWLKNALAHRGYSFVGENTDQNLYCNIDLTLKLAHIRASSTSKATNIVLGVNQSDQLHTKYFRGAYAGMNWYGTASEVKKSFNKALGKALELVENDLSQSCL